MQRPGITTVSLFKLTVWLFAIPTVLLLLVAGLLVFFMFGGGWAYAGVGGCHFVLNPFGLTVVAGMALGVLAFLFLVGRRIIRRYQTHKTPVGR